mgnify:CR=1 FL=1
MFVGDFDFMDMILSLIGFANFNLVWQIILQIVILVLGFVFLVKGADWFVDGAASIATKFGIPQLIIGLTIVAMGTSAPEAAVSITAAAGGNADITIGNVVGSNILNIFVILGLTALVNPVVVQHAKAIVIPDVIQLAQLNVLEHALDVMEHVDKQFSSSETMNLLWVGKMDFRKQLHLAVAVLGKLKDLDVILHVCGSGMSEQISNMEMLAHKLGVSDKLNYHGVVTHDEVLRMMKLYDLLLFTSISEGTPHVVQEAIAYHLPVVCHDTCGQGDCVDESIGYKVPISCPKQSVEEFATFIRKLYYKRDKLKELSENCFAASQKMSWDKKVHDMLDIYQKCLKS